MSDNIGSPSPEPAESEAWVNDWIHEANDAHLAMRQYGVEILQRIRGGLPLSPRETAMVQLKNQEWEVAKKDYEQALGEPMFQDDAEFAKILAEGIAAPLLSIREHPDADHGQFTAIAQLDDQRPTKGEI